MTYMTTVDARTVIAVQSHLLEQGTPFPTWGENGRAHDAFQGAVTAALVRLNLARQITDVPAASQEIARRLTGLGVLQPFLDDPADTIQEVIVRDGYTQVERDGRIEDAGELAPDKEFAHIVSRTSDRARHQTSGSRPYVLADLPDGSRFTAIVPPLSVEGTAINIRRFPRHRLTLEGLRQRQMFVPPAQFRREEVTWDSLQHRQVRPASQETSNLLVGFLSHVAETVGVSMLISGEFSSGKSTLLGALASLIPPTVQVAVVETFKEVQLAHPHPLRVVVPGDRENFPTMDEVLNVVITRMRPDLLIIGEIVRDEAPRFLDAVNLGKRAWSTIHAGDCRGALHRLETKALTSGLPHQAIREQIAASVNLVVHLARFGAERKVAEVATVDGLTTSGEYALHYLPVGRVSSSTDILWQTWDTLR